MAARRTLTGPAVNPAGATGGAVGAAPQLPINESNPITPVDTFEGTQNTSRPDLAGLLTSLQGNLETTTGLLRQQGEKATGDAMEDLQAEMQKQLTSGATIEQIQLNPKFAGESDFLMAGAWETAGRHYALQLDSALREQLLDPAIVNSQDPAEIATALGIIVDGGIPDGVNDDYVRGFHEQAASQIAKLINPHIEAVSARKLEFQSEMRVGEGKSIGDQVLSGSMNPVQAVNDITAQIDEWEIGTGLGRHEANTEMIKGLHVAVMESLSNPHIDADDRAEVYDAMRTAIPEYTSEGQAIDADALTMINQLEAQANRIASARMESKSAAVFQEVEGRYTAALNSENKGQSASDGPGSANHIFEFEIIPLLGTAEAGIWMKKYGVGRGFTIMSPTQSNYVLLEIGSFDIKTPADLHVELKKMNIVPLDVHEDTMAAFLSAIAKNHSRLDVLTGKSARDSLDEINRRERNVMKSLKLTDKQVLVLSDILGQYDQKPDGDGSRPHQPYVGGGINAIPELSEDKVAADMEAGGFDPLAIRVGVAFQRTRRVFRAEVLRAPDDILANPEEMHQWVQKAATKANETLSELLIPLIGEAGAKLLRPLDAKGDLAAASKAVGSDVMTPKERMRRSTQIIGALDNNEINDLHLGIQNGTYDATPEVEAILYGKIIRGQSRPNADFIEPQDYLARILMRTYIPDGLDEISLTLPEGFPGSPPKSE